MNTEIKVQVALGSNISQAIKEAKALCQNSKVFWIDQVSFDFNNIKCTVTKETNVEHLMRDYHHAHLMGWETIGPDPVHMYDEKTLESIKNKKSKNEKEAEKRRKEHQKEQELKDQQVQQKIANETMEIINLEGYQAWKEKNNDGYGGACFTFAERWALLMQVAIKNGESIDQCADILSHEADVEGITGFMYGVAVSILSNHWKHGEKLKKWHNKKHGREDADGVVNPAILTVSIK